MELIKFVFEVLLICYFGYLGSTIHNYSADSTQVLQLA